MFSRGLQKIAGGICKTAKAPLFTIKAPSKVTSEHNHAANKTTEPGGFKWFFNKKTDVPAEVTALC